MKSVGEIMAIGRSFEEAIQKGIRMVGLGMHGFVGNKEEISIEAIDEELTNPTDRRIFAITEALNKNYSIDEIYSKTKIDRWFLQKLKNIFNLKLELESLECRAEGEVEEFIDRTSWFRRITLYPRIVARGKPEEYVRRALDMALKYSTINQSLKSEIVIQPEIIIR